MSAATDEIWMAGDRLFFQRHPDRQFRIRALYPDEFMGRDVGAANAVIVQRVADGTRARYPVTVRHDGCRLRHAIRHLDDDNQLRAAHARWWEARCE